MSFSLVVANIPNSILAYASVFSVKIKIPLSVSAFCHFFLLPFFQMIHFHLKYHWNAGPIPIFRTFSSVVNQTPESDCILRKFPTAVMLKSTNARLSLKSPSNIWILRMPVRHAKWVFLIKDLSNELFYRKDHLEALGMYNGTKKNSHHLWKKVTLPFPASYSV